VTYLRFSRSEQPEADHGASRQQMQGSARSGAEKTRGRCGVRLARATSGQLGGKRQRRKGRRKGGRNMSEEDARGGRRWRVGLGK
jgi:hypothetical protein